MSPQSIKEHVMEKINQGRVAMRPRWQFVLKAALAFVGMILALLLVVYLVSFTIFALHQNGSWFAPSFGSRGVWEFMRSLPLLLIGASFVFLIILEVLVRRYSFAYRRPLVYSAIGVIVFVVASGFVIASTSLHRGMYRRAEQGHLPIAGPMYREFGMKRFDSIHPGQILKLTDDGFVMQNLREGEITVIVDNQTRLPFGFDFVIGDRVVVMGKLNDHKLPAFGVRKIEEGVMSFSDPSRDVMRGRQKTFRAPWILDR